MTDDSNSILPLGRPPLEVERASDVDEAPIDWLWEPHIPLGMITGIDGDPDMAKSTLTLDWTARTTRGVPFPGEPVAHQHANVIIISAEDNIRQVVKPRLRVAGADLDRVLFVKRPRDHLGRIVPLTIPADLVEIERVIKENDVRLLIIDPIAAYWGEEVRTHNDASVRKAMMPLKDVAESTNAAIVIVRHLNKSGEAKAAYRGGGSIAITAAARSVLLAGPHPDNEGERVLARIKNNLAPPSDAWAYRADAIESPSHPGRTLPYITWLRTERLSADDVLRGEDARKDAPARRAAADDLRQILADGPMSVADVKKVTNAAGHSWRTVQRAAERLGVVHAAVRPESGFGVESWEWSLPDTYDFVELMRRAGVPIDDQPQ